MQTALARTWPRWRRLREPDAATTYVRRTMYRTYLGWRRRRWQGEVPTAVLPDRGIELIDEDGIGAQALVHDMVRRLPPGQRAVVVLRYFEDLSEKDTPEVLGCSVGNVKPAVASARRAADDARSPRRTDGGTVMTRLEEMLREGLREVPDPPHDIEVSDVRERVLRKRRTLGAAGTFVLVLALAAGLTVALTRGRPNPVPPTANRRPSALANVLWRDRITGSTLLVRNGTMQINIQCHPMTYLERSAGGIVHRGRMLVQGPSCGGPQGPPRRGYTREVARFAAVTAGPSAGPGTDRR